MNRDRRKQIEGVIAILERLQMDIENQSQIIGDIGSDEEEYRDNIPENLQGSDRYQTADDAANALECAREELDAIDLGTIVQHLQEAIDA